VAQRRSFHQVKTIEPPGNERSDNVPVYGDSFSPVLGGPVYRLYLRTRLARAPIELVWRRIAGLMAICWLPLFVLAGSTGHLFRGVAVPFLLDIDCQIKLLVALPVLIASEPFAHRRIPGIFRQFIDRGIVAQEDRAAFADRVASAVRLRNSVPVELSLLICAFTIWHWAWSHDFALGLPSWYGARTGGRTYLTAPGYWYAFVSLPILRFLLLRWYFRILVWYRLLWSVRELPFHLNLFHPDRAAGLGFLSGSVFAIAPVLACQTIVLAGMIGERIWHAGAALLDFETEMASVVVFLMLVALAPLSFFVARLITARLTARREFGILASRYVDAFRMKWIERSRQEEGGKLLLGTPDLQSLADLGNAYATVSDMRIQPFSLKTIVRLGVLIAAPLAPLALTMMPLHKVVDGLVKLLF
jgi:hypothetical protein